VVAEVDFDRYRRFRQDHRFTEDRRPELYNT
jgi:hypothetical protein